jgi:hypothetical protein
MKRIMIARYIREDNATPIGEKNVFTDVPEHHIIAERLIQKRKRVDEPPTTFAEKTSTPTYSAPNPKMQRLGNTPKVSTEDRATLRAMAEELLVRGPERWNIIRTSDIGQRLGFDNRQLREIVKVKRSMTSTGAPWSDELQTKLFAEVSKRGREWEDIRRNGADGAFVAFTSEVLRKNYDKERAGFPSGFKEYFVEGKKVRGMSLVKGNQYQVVFKGAYIGFCRTIAEAASKWDEAARAAGVPESELNNLPQEVVEAAIKEYSPSDSKPSRAKYIMSKDGTQVSFHGGQFISRETFLVAAEELYKQSPCNAYCTWGALANKLGLNHLIGKSRAVHLCWIGLTATDKTIFQFYNDLNNAPV